VIVSVLHEKYIAMFRSRSTFKSRRQRLLAVAPVPRAAALRRRFSLQNGYYTDHLSFNL